AYAGIFIALALDVAARLWTMRARFQTTGDAAILVSAELVRAGVGTAAAGLGAMLVWRARRAGTRALGFMILLAGIAYLKAFAGSFPGHVQERVAEWLFATGVPARALGFVFAQPVWALWLGLAAFV